MFNYTLYIFTQGLLSIHKYIEGRRVTLTKQDVITILSEENPFNFKLSQKAQEDVYAIGNFLTSCPPQLINSYPATISLS